jgi:hypothetical protein
MNLDCAVVGDIFCRNLDCAIVGISPYDGGASFLAVGFLPGIKHYRMADNMLSFANK